MSAARCSGPLQRCRRQDVADDRRPEARDELTAPENVEIIRSASGTSRRPGATRQPARGFAPEAVRRPRRSGRPARSGRCRERRPAAAPASKASTRFQGVGWYSDSATGFIGIRLTWPRKPRSSRASERRVIEGVVDCRRSSTYSNETRPVRPLDVVAAGVHQLGERVLAVHRHEPIAKLVLRRVERDRPARPGAASRPARGSSGRGRRSRSSRGGRRARAPRAS